DRHVRSSPPAGGPPGPPCPGRRCRPVLHQWRTVREHPAALPGNQGRPGSGQSRVRPGRRLLPAGSTAGGTGRRNPDPALPLLPGRRRRHRPDRDRRRRGRIRRVLARPCRRAPSRRRHGRPHGRRPELPRPARPTALRALDPQLLPRRLVHRGHDRRTHGRRGGRPGHTARRAPER
ncbi:MAG: Membrane protein mosC, partial [uncultured Arthrobacter sp.]